MATHQLIAVVVVLVGTVAALVLLIRHAQGSPRVLGILGIVLILLGVLGRYAFQWLAEAYLGQIDTATIVSVLAVDALLAGLLTGAGLILAARAVVVAGWPPRSGRTTLRS